jgi:hypothetical protein
MRIIVPGITSLAQHLQRLHTEPEAYRPAHCPHCGQGGLWCHGYYPRQADRQGRGEANLNPVPMPRFYCRHCQRTCSALPECLPPRRWYLWSVQQQALAVLLAGGSLHQASHNSGCARATVRRWWHWLTERTTAFSSVLRARFAELGRSASGAVFWQHCWRQLGLARAMYWLAQAQVTIP